MKNLILIFAALLAMALPLAAQSDPKKPTASPTPISDAQAVDPDKAANDRADENAKRMDVYQRPSPGKRFRRYVNSMFGPFSIARAVGAAGVSTWTNTPEEWEPTWEGFGRRFASNMGRSIMKNSMMYGLDEVMKLDSKYYRSKKRDVGSRVSNAVVSVVTARKADGSRTVGVPRIFSTYASSVIVSETWYPGRNWKDGLRNASFTLGVNAGFNLFKEFIWK